jgi:hypothetical protein
MIRSVAVALSFMFAASGAAPAAAEQLPPPWLPKDPGSAHCVNDGESARLFDDAVAISPAAREWRATPVFVTGTQQRWRAGEIAVVTLQPFEVRVWELSPADLPSR